MSKIIHRTIDPYYIQIAKENAPSNAYNKRSITNGERNVVGLLGELYYLRLVEEIYNDHTTFYKPTFDYDVTIKANNRDIKVDVKTKQRTGPPKDYYAASIAAYSKDQQDCDYYAFTSITVDKYDSDSFSDFYFLGFIKKEDFFKQATFMKKGDLDGDNVVWKNGVKRPFTITEDCYNLPYSKLTQYSDDFLEPAFKDGFKFV